MALKVPILTASEILITSCVEVQKLASGLSEKAKVMPNNAMPEAGFFTDDVASAWNELVDSKVVTVVGDKRLCI